MATHYEELQSRVLELQETNKALERNIKVQRILHKAHRKGCNTNIGTLRDLLLRVEKQRDEAWLRIEELEKQLAEVLQVKLTDDQEPEYVFEAHLEGMNCGRRPCGTCSPNTSTGAGT